MHRNSLVLCFLICLSLSASTRAQYACTPGEDPSLSDPVELEIIENQPFPGTVMVPGMQVISAGGAVALMNEPSGESDQCGELDPGVPRQILGIATDEFGEIWYMIRENEIAYHLVWCRGNTLIPAPGHITDVSYLIWLASGLASNGQMTTAHNLIANFAGIGVISEEEGDVLIAVYYPGNPARECENMFWYQDCTVLFAGEWGFNFYNICNMASMHEISPSGKYYAIGADGTGTWRGTIDLVDLETGVKYRYNIPRSGVGSYSNWIEGDFLLIQSLTSSPMSENWTGFGNQPWLNYSYRTSAEGVPRDIVLMHGNRAWMILPEDMYYNYRIGDNYGVYENGIFFDVVASPNVIPALAGIESCNDFSEWIDSMGGQQAAFPSFDFRIYIDMLNMSVSCCNLSTLSSVSGETSSGPLDGMEFALIPSGSFEMGSPYSEDHRYHDEEQHRVHVDSFELMTTEVTQGMWREVMGISDPERNMTRGEGDDYPMY